MNQASTRDAAYWRADYQRRRDRVLANKRLRYQKNKAPILAKQREYRLRNSEAIAERKAVYRRKHRDEIRASQRDWERRNREKHLANKARHRNANKEKYRAYRKSWEQRNPDKIWRKQHPEEMNAYSRAYYASHVEHREYLKVKNYPWTQKLICKWEAVQGLCYICGRYIQKEQVTADHVVPKSKGGSHDSSNIMPVHHGCNSRKGNRLNFPVKRPDLLKVCNG